ncbi:transcriptional regulator TACO1-like protein [Crassisporium funariophilum]|nr:transcriptional regulator TACO1-like protein [Crassisporium funariophilum]
MYHVLVRPSQRIVAHRYFSLHHARLSGHNKWSKIKDKKGAADAQKSALYTKANQEIATAVRAGGSTDPQKNAQLAAALKKAKEQGVPKENIEKTLARVGNAKDRGGTPATYEALAFGSVGIIIDALTDNANRTIHGIREILNAHSAHMTPVKYMFQRVGRIEFTARPSGSKDEFDRDLDKLCQVLGRNGATDVDLILESESLQDVFRITCEPGDLKRIEDIILAWKTGSTVTVHSVEIIYTALDSLPVEEDLREKVEVLRQDLGANTDILKVWTTVD